MSACAIVEQFMALREAKALTDKQFQQRCQDAADDSTSDGQDLSDVASDLAASLYYEPDIKAYVKKKFNPKNDRIAIAIIADQIAG